MLFFPHAGGCLMGSACAHVTHLVNYSCRGLLSGVARRLSDVVIRAHSTQECVFVSRRLPGPVGPRVGQVTSSNPKYECAHERRWHPEIYIISPFQFASRKAENLTYSLGWALRDHQRFQMRRILFSPHLGVSRLGLLLHSFHGSHGSIENGLVSNDRYECDCTHKRK
ncbi:hypothetical protein EDB92DRAFT_1270395 [Lactarius akahatsu]|uniref:Uncharacterized protein n=1 Tax=Lactarius akahatsu TaxID=416441 RepID=A0AAD4Q5N2_9AGAM|nr:hypothetical protein EDB92DRAFT_1270395 [Lactarius akahatsu]